MYAENSVSLATILNPVVGYERAAELVKRAVESGRGLREVVEESGYLTPEQVAEVFDLRRWTEPGVLGG